MILSTTISESLTIVYSVRYIRYMAG